jgi:hypothetical protein
MAYHHKTLNVKRQEAGIRNQEAEGRRKKA